MDKQEDSDFAWANCHDKNPHTRVCLKQQAVDDAFICSKKLCGELNAVLNEVGPDHAVAYDLMCGTSFESGWNELRKANDQLEILVGVAGQTGAGKTSLLNVLLETPDLLPSSSQQAATATVCRIAYNCDKTAGHEFRAEFVFRSKEDVVKELNSVLNSIQERQALLAQEFEDEEERIEMLDELNISISRGISQVCAVWDLNKGELEYDQHTAEEIMARNPENVKALDTTKTIYSSDSAAFASEVKPYLDATRTLEGLTAWPLIKEVNIFVKCSLLRHGLVLVELPGLSDSNEGRSRVAED
ncbi:hypothetical protein QBC38DRAFT_450238 [Podospora fimiseda]|uniref:Dynamin N-terminal domain-containing protein n=1 Tax=Podospora fimiseda TaxID=252190 RepID=A0AAN7BZM6_9PEZI|nr:hypothetical protein QBC38DRAFT_450238 [Podospora fimiseda]